MKRFTSFLYRLIEPRSKTDDLRRRELIFNIILSALIIFLIFANIATISESIVIGSLYRGLSPLITLVILFIFLSFFFLSRKGFFIVPAYVLIIIFFLLTSYMGYRWGVDLPAEILFYALIIVMAGILIGTRFAFIITIISCSVIVIVGYLQNENIILANRYWTSEPWGTPEILATVVILFVIATVSWLSNREIEKSLIRARKSEADLRDERDSLEIKVEERTKELKEVQAEKMTQLYRFAEFGRISAGLFHDLINPLNAVSLNMEKLKSQRVLLLRDSVGSDVSLDETFGYLENATRAAHRLENMVAAVRKQLARKETKALFSVVEEIRHVIDVLSHKAQKENVKLHFMPGDNIKTLKIFGDAVKFNQVVLNLIANGIDACMSVKVRAINRWVQVSLVEESEVIIMGVKDNGVGISGHHIDKIFEPFFSTKITGQGIGIGLSIAKRIAEKDFGGLLVAKSKVGKGSFFKVSLPIRKIVNNYET